MKGFLSFLKVLDPCLPRDCSNLQLKVHGTVIPHAFLSNVTLHTNKENSNKTQQHLLSGACDENKLHCIIQPLRRIIQPLQRIIELTSYGNDASVLYTRVGYDNPFIINRKYIKAVINCDKR